LQGETLIKVLLVVMSIAAIAGCSNADDGVTDEQPVGYASMFSLDNTYTTHSANRYFSGTGNVPVEPMQVEFSTANNFLKWVVADEISTSGTAWGVVRGDDRWSTFRAVGDEPLKVKMASPLEEHEHPPVLSETERRGIRLSVNAVSDPPDLELIGALSRIENIPDGSTIHVESSRCTRIPVRLRDIRTVLSGTTLNGAHWSLGR
jgi:hypothetical protein